MPVDKTMNNALKRSASKMGTLRVAGPDSHGIVAACTQLLGKYGCNIITSDQWTDRRESLFFQRVAFDYQTGGQENSTQKAACQSELNEIANEFGLEAKLNWRDRKKKIGVMVSKFDHCLWEVLLRHSAHELDADIEMVVSNHENLRHVADTFGVPYHVVPVTPHNKLEQEAKQLELLGDVDLVVLARYMQVLSDRFLAQFPDRIINIHHSFLPAFIGGNPYKQAYARGVKMIGATAHYTTLDLDDGPIIAQDVIHCTHRDEVSDLIRKGRSLERNVLLRAIESHLDDRIFVYNNRCVVFSD